MKTKDLWASPAQFSVMTILCWKDHDKRGFAAPSKDEIARLVGLSVGYVKQIYWQLEAMEAMARLGPDAEFGGRQRFVLTIERAIEKAIVEKGVSFSVPGIAGDPPPGVAGDPGGDRGRSPGGLPAIPPSLANNKTIRQVQNAKEATAAPRLPLFPLDVRPPHPEHRALNTARDYRLKKLRRRVAGLARTVLMNPALGRELLDGEIATSIDGLVEATKRLCGRKHVHGYVDVVHAMCTSELFKFRHPNVLNGTAPRPRDRRSR